MRDSIGNERDAALYSAWEHFVQTGKVCDYLSYCQQDDSHGRDSAEGMEIYAGDGQRSGDSGKGTEQR